MAFRPPKGMNIADHLQLCPSPVTAAEVSATLPFVIPSEAEGPAVLFLHLRPLLEIFSTRDLLFHFRGQANVPWANRLRAPFSHQRKPQVPPLRVAPVGMTNLRTVAHHGMG